MNIKPKQNKFIELLKRYQKTESKFVEKVYAPMETLIFGVAFGGTIYILSEYRMDEIVNFVNIDSTIQTWLLLLGLFSCVNFLMHLNLRRKVEDTPSQSLPTHEEA